MRLAGDPAGLAALRLASLAPLDDRIAADGRYLTFGERSDPVVAVAPAGLAASQPIAVVIALDDHFTVRLASAARLWRALTARSAAGPKDGLTELQRQRLVLMLRALDARASGARRRDIAAALFGRSAVPPGAAFDDHHLKSRTARLIRDGQAMVAGGYRRLLAV
ncbi:DUF2285 domain-containing protein [Phenylobacterium montanum]|uniref:DUF2285 domain-containing protein n=1 Tax=Phenylobacterium montanum TaxID=2823693 RepID=A0A975IWT8_9CAUL|nr:DUF2285 domain-containing protein [Caulobacter sp. S6]QUD90422.1 DUF2285 domain-containing protein [Caulobacter sp. S6]